MAPFVSIITATYNSEKFIQKSIDAVRNLNFKDFEYIIVDGNSKDDTTNILKNNADIITRWISEPDNGIYDAWNKGLKMASGDWIMFVGADDYLRADALNLYKKYLDQHDTNDVLFVSAKNQIVSSTGSNIRVFGWPWDWKTFRRFNTIAHPAALQSIQLYKKYGTYNTDYKIVGDYELLLRPKKNLNALFMNNIVIDVTEGGVSNQSKMFYEIKKAVINTANISGTTATIDCYVSILKINLKKFIRKIGFNVHLKKSFK